MTQYNRSAVADAVTVLAMHPDAHGFWEYMQALVALNRAHPLSSAPEIEALGVLVDMHRTDEAAYDKLMWLADRKRQELGNGQLIKLPSHDFSKVAYMRDLMFEKRLRTRRAVEIENMLRPERDQLRGRARLDFMDEQARKWKAELDARMARARAAAGGRLEREVYERLGKQFWAWVDEQLDAAEAEARNKKRGV